MKTIYLKIIIDQQKYTYGMANLCKVEISFSPWDTKQAESWSIGSRFNSFIKISRWRAHGSREENRIKIIIIF